MCCSLLLKILENFLQNISKGVFACSLASASFFSWIVATEAGIKELRQNRSNKNAENTFIIPTDAPYYKDHRRLKQFKNYNTSFDMFQFTQETSSGSSPVLS
jgi:hypothetical protein